MPEEEALKPYLRVLTWKFADEHELAGYESSRKSSFAYTLIAISFYAVVLYGLAYLTGGDNWILPGMLAVIPCVRFFPRWYKRKKPGLTGLTLSLSPKFILMEERFGEWERYSVFMLFRYRTKQVKSALWVADGLWLDLDRPFSRGVVINKNLFLQEGGMQVLYEWCEQNGIKVEGVPPLRESYDRPLEEKRGL